MKSWIGLALLLSPLMSWGRLSDGKAHMKLVDRKVVGSVDKGFHFNKDAPASMTFLDQTLQPLKKTPQELIFDVSKVKGPSFRLSFYVCDDQNTVCEAHENQYRIAEGRLLEGTATEPASANKKTTVKAVNKSSDLKLNDQGFYQDNLAGALVLAGKEGKLALVDFSAPWCPSCIRLETEVFGQKVFKSATDKLIKVSVNVDKAESKELSKKYDIKVIPTLILMNSEGEELARLTDYRPADQIAKDLEDLQRMQLASLAELTKQAHAGDEKARRALGERAFRAVNFEEAVKWLGPLKPSLMLANSEVGLAQEQNEEAGKSGAGTYQKVLEKWIAAYPRTLEAILWRGELLKLLKGEDGTVSSTMKEIGNQNVTAIESLLKSSKDRTEVFAQTLSGDYTGFEKMELWSQLSDTYDLLNEKDKASQARAALKKELSAVRLSEKRPGQVLVALGYMKQAQLKDRMVTWYEKLIKTYPETDVYYSKLARFYVREKQPAKALSWAQKAAAMKSEQLLYNMKTLAEVHRDLNHKSEALEVVNKALALPEAQLDQNKKSVAALEELKKSLSK